MGGMGVAVPKLVLAVMEELVIMSLEYVLVLRAGKVRYAKARALATASEASAFKDVSVKTVVLVIT